ncbi:MAG TPA: hypothetical protein VFR91_10085 [Dyella sp.]|nr:hypothetical protein [Dyella sp.]
MRRSHAFALAAAVTLACGLPPPALLAAPQGPPATTGQAPVVYGSQLMTPAERNAYRQQMRSMKTAQEREAFRARHHEEMQQRARKRGVQLPDMPPMGGARGGMGPGMNAGMGRGMGRGMSQGMGPGMGPGMQRMQSQQETRERAQPGTSSSSGQVAPTRKQTGQEPPGRNTGDQSGGQ